MNKNMKCSICNDNIVPFGLKSDDPNLIWGNNPQPFMIKGVMLKEEDRCCQKCQHEVVIPLREALPNWREQIKLDPNDPDINIV